MKKMILSAVAILAFAGVAMAQQPEQRPQQPQAGAQAAPQGQPQAGMAQGSQQQEDRAEDRAGRLAQRLMLDDATATQFISLYEEYQKALDEAAPKGKKGDRKGKGGKKDDKAQPAGQQPQPQEQAAPTDAEIIEQIQAGLAAQKARLEVQETYLAKFQKILTARQLQQLFSQGQRHGQLHEGPQGGQQPQGQQPQGPQGAPQGGQQPQGQPQAGLQGAPQGGQPGAAPQGAPQGAPTNE